jgi:hypothetical protein
LYSPNLVFLWSWTMNTYTMQNLKNYGQESKYCLWAFNYRKVCCVHVFFLRMLAKIIFVCLVPESNISSKS